MPPSMTKSAPAPESHTERGKKTQKETNKQTKYTPIHNNFLVIEFTRMIEIQDSQTYQMLLKHLQGRCILRPV